MAEIVDDGKCDLEHLEIDKISCFSLKFDWTIEYFNSSSLHNRESSKINLPGSIWHFKINSELNKCSYKYYQTIYVSVNPVKNVYVTGTIKINDTLSNIATKICSNVTLIYSNLTLPYAGSVKILLNLKVYGLVPVDKITFTQDQRNSKFMEAECRKNFHITFKTLWKNPQFSDVRIQVGEETMMVHKNVLFAKSPVFARMFLSPAVESKRDLVTIEDVSFGTMERFLSFLYGDFPDMEALQDLEEMCELYYVSDKYEVMDLRDWCSRVMIERMSTENVFRMIDLFDSHNDAECMKLAEDYCFFHLKEVVETDGWKAISLKNPNFASVMWKRVANHIQ